MAIIRRSTFWIRFHAMPLSRSDVMSEVLYRSIPGFPGYTVGEDGSVWSCRNRRGGIGAGRRQLKPNRSTGRIPYLFVVLCKNNRHYFRLVHRLVLETHVGACPPGMQCRHLNGDPADNRLGNLCWGSRRENAADKLVHGTATRGERHGLARLTETDIRAIRASTDRSRGWMTRLATEYGVSQTHISRIIKGRAWQGAPCKVG